ncbi:MAG: HEPN domain-containing protein [Anaerolineae bacterium]
MSETERLAEVRRWLRYAREDLSAADAMVGQPDIAPRHACWLAQPAAEKALKAVRVFLQVEFPRRHDLDALRNVVPDGWSLKEAHPDLAALTEWAVEARHPGDWPDATDADARAAVEQARGVWQSVQADLAQRGLNVEPVS